MDQNALLDELAPLAVENAARIEALVRPLSRTQLAWRPPEGGWGIAALLEHLCIADDGYLARLRALLPERPGARVAAQWSPRLAGRLLANAMRAPRKLPAPKSLHPPAAARDLVLDAYLERARELVAMIERARSVELRRLGLGSPVFALIRLNAGDALSILAWHGRRHLGEMVRVRAHASFPAS